MIYLVYCILVIILAYLGDKKNRFSGASLFRILLCFLFICFIGFRKYTVGCDSGTYMNHYYYYGEWGCDFVELGFNWVNMLLYRIGFHYNIFFFTCALLTGIPIYFALERLKSYFPSAVLIYLVTFVFLVNGMRQGIVCGLFLYSYQFITERKLLKYLLFIGIGWLFHSSVIFLLPIYFLYNKILPTKYYLYIYCASFVFCFIDISQYLPLLTDFDFGVRNYSKLYENITASERSLFGFLYKSVFNISLLYLFLKSRLEKTQTCVFNLFFTAICLVNIGYYQPLIGRLTIYFDWFYMLILPESINIVTKGNIPKKSALSVYFIFMCSAVLLNTLLSASNRLLPYKFFWE